MSRESRRKDCRSRSRLRRTSFVGKGCRGSVRAHGNPLHILYLHAAETPPHPAAHDAPLGDSGHALWALHVSAGPPSVPFSRPSHARSGKIFKQRVSLTATANDGVALMAPGTAGKLLGPIACARMRELDPLGHLFAFHFASSALLAPNPLARG